MTTAAPQKNASLRPSDPIRAATVRERSLRSPIRRGLTKNAPPTSSNPEHNLWLPPTRLRRYQLNKAIGGALVTAIFVGWLILQWSNPVMRVLACVLIATTAWVVIASIIDDRARARGRQIAINATTLRVTTPDAPDNPDAPNVSLDIRLADITQAHWREDDQPGLWLFGRDDRVLAHLDTNFLADQAETRAFLGWARQHADLPFEVRWPQTL